MIEEGQEYTTPIYDEDGNLIEVIEDYDVFVEDETSEEEYDDAYYLGEEGDLAEEDFAEEENVDYVESRILAANEKYQSARDSVIERLTAILEKGEISAEDNAELSDAMHEYTDSVNDMKDKLNEDKQGNNDTNEINQGSTVTVLPEELQHLIDLMNNGGRNDLLFVDEEGRVLVEGEQVPKLKLVELEVEKLVADYAEIEDLVAKKATIEDLNVVKAQIGTLNVEEVIADIIHGNTADIGDLTADIGKIETLVGGNLTMDNIASLILTSKKVTVEDAFIKNAMIDSVSAAKINTGILNTNLVNIQSEDGSLVLNGTLQQFKDQNGKVRIQMGKDAQGNFTFGLFDATGTGTLINSDGITEKAIGDGLIIDKMVGDNANISGNKLDIDSVITEVNNGASTIKGTKVKLDEQNQTLDVAFNSMTTTVTEQGKAVGSHTTSINTMKGQIGTLISDTEILEGGNKVTVKDAYSKINQKVGEFGVSLKDVQSEFDNMEIGGANILYNADFRQGRDKWANSHGCNLSVITPTSPEALALNDKVMKIQIITGQTYAMMTQTHMLVPEQQYTVSCYLLLDNEYNTANPGIRIYYNNGWKGITDNLGMTTEQFGKWTKFTCTFKPNAIYPETVIAFGISGNPGQFCYVTVPQLEKGTVATSFSVNPKDIQSDFDGLTIGTRNLVANSAPTTLTGYSLNTATNWSYALIDCPTATKGKSIRVTNVNKASGGVYMFPINKDGLINGETYTLSVMMRASNNNIRMTVRQEQMVDSTMINMSTDWKLITFTSKVDTSKTSKGIIFYVDMNTVNPGDWFELHSVMFEKSTKASNFTEAPEDMESSINSLGTRIKSAESKLTLDGLTTIIGNTYITPSTLDSKGYATTSDVTQSATNLIAKFSTSGGYNKLYNGNFRNGLNYWIKKGNVDSVIATTLSCPDNMYGIDMPGEIGKINYYAQEFPYDRIGKITLYYWTHLTSGGANGTTNPYSNIQIVVNHTDGTNSFYSSKSVSNLGAWEKKEFTIDIQKRPKKITVELINRDTTKRLYFTNIMLEEGEISNGFTTNPNEAYDGIIDMGRDGIVVKQSNYNGYTAMRPHGFTVHDGKEEVIKCDNTGLSVKGKIYVIDGSISEKALAGTMIDGQYIKTGTIKAKSIQIGDFTNYFTTPTNYTTNAKYPAYAMNPGTGQIFVSNPITHFNGGEKFLVTGFVYAPTTNGSTTNFNLEFVWRDENGGFISASTLPKPVEPNTQITLNDEITIPTRPANAKYGDFKIFCGNCAYSLIYSQPCMRMMMSGSLIVDGAIDGKTIRGAEIIGGEIKSIATNEEGSPIFSLSSDGRIVGGYIDCYGLNVEGDISADTLSINSINNSRYPQALDEDITVYINASVISDEEMFDNAKFSCMEDLFAVAPRNLNGYTIFIIFETDYTGNVNLSAFNSGSCYLYLQKHTIRGYISCYGKSMRYAIYGNTRGNEGGSANCANIKPPKGRSMSGYAYSLICDYTTMTAYDLNIYPGVDTSITPSGIIVTNLSNAYLNNINAVGKPQHLVRSHSTSQVYIAESSGLSSGNTFSAVSGSIQCLNPVNQAGSSIGKPTYTSGNAQIFSSGVTFAQADNSGSNDSGSSTKEVTTVTLKANSGDTYRRTVYKSWKKDGTVRQGDYGYGDCDGFWFFGSQISNYTSKNITKVAITIKRNTGAGSSSPVTHTLVGHGYSSRPSGAPSAMGSAIRSSFNLSQGNSVTLNLTAAEIAIFKKYKGIGLKSPYSSSYYSSCSASCTVKITYEE